MRVTYSSKKTEVVIRLQGWTEIRQFLSLQGVVDHTRGLIRKLCGLPQDTDGAQ